MLKPSQITKFGGLYQTTFLWITKDFWQITRISGLKLTQVQRSLIRSKQEVLRAITKPLGWWQRTQFPWDKTLQDYFNLCSKSSFSSFTKLAQNVQNLFQKTFSFFLSFFLFFFENLFLNSCLFGKKIIKINFYFVGHPVSCWSSQI